MDTSLNSTVFLEEVQRIIIECDRSCSVCYNFIIQLGQHIRNTHSSALGLASEAKLESINYAKSKQQSSSTNMTVTESSVDPLENNFSPSPDNTEFELVEVKVEVDPDQFYMDGVERGGACDNDPFAQFQNNSHAYGVNPEFEHHQGQVCSEFKTVSREQSKSECTPTHSQTSAAKRSKRLKDASEYNCKECIWGFDNPSYMETHMFNTHGQYDTKNLFNDEYTDTRNSSDAEDSCQNCRKYFPSASTLHKHTTSVRCRKVFSCEMCERHFIKKPSLQKHMMHHTGERPFKCVRCDESFIDESALKRHIRTHDSAICKFCYKKFSGRVELNQHYFKDHLEEGPSVDHTSKEYVCTDTDSD